MDHHNEEEHPFYGKDVIRNSEQDYIRNLLKKYQSLPVNEELKKKVWEELQNEKSKGNITIPFKIALRLDSEGKFPPFLEVILDTKV